MVWLQIVNASNKLHVFANYSTKTTNYNLVNAQGQQQFVLSQ